MSLFDKILDIIVDIDNDRNNNNEMKETLEESMKSLLYLKNIIIENWENEDIERKRDMLIHVYTLMLENIYESYTESPFYVDYKNSNSIDFFHKNFLNLEIF
jgi:hypothetical protein